MIQLPKRSVTRFFIPLIDVLTLMFCIFLLLPIMEPGTDSPPEPADPGLSAAERQELDRLREVMAKMSGKLTDQERAELEQIRRDKIETLQSRLAVRVLEIDADSGRLYYYAPERTEINSEATARTYIDRQKSASPRKEVYFLILFPRKRSAYPLESQVKRYDRWFEGAAHGFDNPQAIIP